jgi:uncharacterized membrane protein YdfJ with MMPL/SSD domain
MMILLRSTTAGMVSMVPNVFPIVLVFGFMGWRGILVDIGTMMTASIALGVAVDGTLHYLTWFQRGLADGLDRFAAIRSAYQRCGTAMVQTTLIAGIGLSVFGFSTFAPTQRFGILMLALLVAALLGDLVLLPALLAGPLGSVFCRRGAGRSAIPSSPSVVPPSVIADSAVTLGTPLVSPHESFLRNLPRPQDRVWARAQSISRKSGGA